MADIFNPDFKEYIELLNKHAVEYVLVGGLAVNLHGYRRSTGDMDIFVNPTKENHQKMKQVHRDFGLFMGDMELLDNFLDTDKYDVYTYGVTPCQIDVMTLCKGVEFEEVYSRSIKYNHEGLDIVLIHLNDLKIAKASTTRIRDKADIQELNKISQKRKS